MVNKIPHFSAYNSQTIRCLGPVFGLRSSVFRPQL